MSGSAQSRLLKLQRPGEHPRQHRSYEAFRAVGDYLSLLQGLLRSKTVAEWLKLCAEADVPAGPINAIDKVFADPQVGARGMLVQMPHPTLGTVQLAGTPLNLSATPAEMRLLPPLLGEHTDVILSRLLALDDSAIAALHRDGVV